MFVSVSGILSSPASTQNDAITSNLRRSVGEEAEVYRLVFSKHTNIKISNLQQGNHIVVNGELNFVSIANELVPTIYVSQC